MIKMIELIQQGLSLILVEHLLEAVEETLYMVSFSGVFAVIIGMPIGILLMLTKKQGRWKNSTIHHGLGFVVNLLRSVPFLILMMAVIPLTRLIVGTSIGMTAAIVPLTISAFPFVARITEAALLEVPVGLVEAANAMGASISGLVCRVLLPEAMPAIIRGIVLMEVTLVGYVSVAGAIGGGGLGDYAIRYGYQRFDPHVILVAVIMLVILVQMIQLLGAYCIHKVQPKAA